MAFDPLSPWLFDHRKPAPEGKGKGKGKGKAKGEVERTGPSGPNRDNGNGDRGSRAEAKKRQRDRDGYRARVRATEAAAKRRHRAVLEDAREHEASITAAVKRHADQTSSEAAAAAARRKGWEAVKAYGLDVSDMLNTEVKARAEGTRPPPQVKRQVAPSYKTPKDMLKGMRALHAAQAETGGASIDQKGYDDLSTAAGAYIVDLNKRVGRYNARIDRLVEKAKNGNTGAVEKLRSADSDPELIELRRDYEAAWGSKRKQHGDLDRFFHARDRILSDWDSYWQTRFGSMRANMRDPSRDPLDRQLNQYRPRVEPVYTFMGSPSVNPYWGLTGEEARRAVTVGLEERERILMARSQPGLIDLFWSESLKRTEDEKAPLNRLIARSVKDVQGRPIDMDDLDMGDPSVSTRVIQQAMAQWEKEWRSREGVAGTNAESFDVARASMDKQLYNLLQKRDPPGLIGGLMEAVISSPGFTAAMTVLGTPVGLLGAGVRSAEAASGGITRGPQLHVEALMGTPKDEINRWLPASVKGRFGSGKEIEVEEEVYGMPLPVTTMKPDWDQAAYETWLKTPEGKKWHAMFRESHSGERGLIELPKWDRDGEDNDWLDELSRPWAYFDNSPKGKADGQASLDALATQVRENGASQGFIEATWANLNTLIGWGGEPADPNQGNLLNLLFNLIADPMNLFAATPLIRGFQKAVEAGKAAGATKGVRGGLMTAARDMSETMVHYRGGLVHSRRLPFEMKPYVDSAGVQQFEKVYDDPVKRFVDAKPIAKILGHPFDPKVGLTKADTEKLLIELAGRHSDDPTVDGLMAEIARLFKDKPVETVQLRAMAEKIWEDVAIAKGMGVTLHGHMDDIVDGARRAVAAHDRRVLDEAADARLAIDEPLQREALDNMRDVRTVSQGQRRKSKHESADDFVDSALPDGFRSPVPEASAGPTNVHYYGSRKVLEDTSGLRLFGYAEPRHAEDVIALTDGIARRYGLGVRWIGNQNAVKRNSPLVELFGGDALTMRAAAEDLSRGMKDNRYGYQPTGPFRSVEGGPVSYRYSDPLDLAYEKNSTGGINSGFPGHMKDDPISEANRWRRQSGMARDRAARLVPGLKAAHARYDAAFARAKAGETGAAVEAAEALAALQPLVARSRAYESMARGLDEKLAEGMPSGRTASDMGRIDYLTRELDRDESFLKAELYGLQAAQRVTRGPQKAAFLQQRIEVLEQALAGVELARMDNLGQVHVARLLDARHGAEVAQHVKDARVAAFHDAPTELELQVAGEFWTLMNNMTIGSAGATAADRAMWKLVAKDLAAIDLTTLGVPVPYTSWVTAYEVLRRQGERDYAAHGALMELAARIDAVWSQHAGLPGPLQGPNVGQPRTVPGVPVAPAPAVVAPAPAAAAPAPAVVAPVPAVVAPAPAVRMPPPVAASSAQSTVTLKDGRAVTLMFVPHDPLMAGSVHIAAVDAAGARIGKLDMQFAGGHVFENFGQVDVAWRRVGVLTSMMDFARANGYDAEEATLRHWHTSRLSTDARLAAKGRWSRVGVTTAEVDELWNNGRSLDGRNLSPVPLGSRSSPAPAVVAPAPAAAAPAPAAAAPVPAAAAPAPAAPIPARMDVYAEFRVSLVSDGLVETLHALGVQLYGQMAMLVGRSKIDGVERFVYKYLFDNGIDDVVRAAVPAHLLPKVQEIIDYRTKALAHNKMVGRMEQAARRSQPAPAAAVPVPAAAAPAPAVVAPVPVRRRLTDEVRGWLANEKDPELFELLARMTGKRDFLMGPMYDADIKTTILVKYLEAHGFDEMIRASSPELLANLEHFWATRDEVIAHNTMVGQMELAARRAQPAPVPAAAAPAPAAAGPVPWTPGPSAPPPAPVTPSIHIPGYAIHAPGAAPGDVLMRADAAAKLASDMWMERNTITWAEFLKLEAEVQQAIVDARGYTGQGLLKGPRANKHAGDGASAPFILTDRDALDLMAKAEVLGKAGIPISAYDEARSVFRETLVRRQRAQAIEAEARAMPGDYRTNYLAVRARMAEAEGRRWLKDYALNSRYGQRPGEVWDAFVAEFEGDQLNPVTGRPVTGFQAKIISGAARETLGVSTMDLDEVAKVLAPIRPPIERMDDARTWLVDNGFWTPKLAEAISLGRKPWSMPEEQKWWHDHFAVTPKWVDQDYLASRNIRDSRYLYEETMLELGVIDMSVDTDAATHRTPSDEQIRRLAYGDDTKANPQKPARTIAQQRQWMVDRWGTWGEDSFPWLMVPTSPEYAKYMKTAPGRLIDRSLIPIEQVDELAEAMTVAAEKRLERLLANGDAKVGADFLPQEHIRYGLDVTDELLDKKSWRPMFKLGKNAAFARQNPGSYALSMLGVIQRMDIVTQIAFPALNLLETSPVGFKSLMTKLANRDLDWMSPFDDEILDLVPDLASVGGGDATMLWNHVGRTHLEKLRAADPVIDATGVGDFLRRFATKGKEVIGTGYESGYTASAWGEKRLKLDFSRRLFQDRYRHFLTEGMSNADAALAARLIVKDKLKHFFPTLENAPLWLHALNQLVPFLSYNFNTRVLYAREFLMHPWMIQWAAVLGAFLEDVNRDAWESEHPGLPWPKGRNARQLMIEVGGEQFTLDLSGMSDIFKGLDTISYFGKGGQMGLTEAIQKFVRVPHPWQANMIAYLMGGDRPLGQGKATLGDVFWPAGLAEFLDKAHADGEFSLGDWFQLATRIGYFREAKRLDPMTSMNAVYYDLPESLRDAYLADHPELQQWWDVNSTDVSKARLELSPSNFKSMSPEDKAKYDAARKGMDKLLAEYAGRMDALLRSGAIDGDAATKALAQEKREAILAYRVANPVLIETGAMFMSREDWAAQREDWIVDDLAQQFFDMQTLLPKRKDFSTDKAFRAATEAFYEGNEAWLDAHPSVRERWESGRSQLEQAVADQLDAASVIRDRINARDAKIARAERREDWARVDALRLANELDYMVLNAPTVAEVQTRGILTPQTGEYGKGWAETIAYAQGRAGMIRTVLLKGADERFWDAATFNERKGILRNEKYGAKLGRIMDRVKARGDWDGFWNEIEGDKGFREWWFSKKAGRKEEWEANQRYLGFIGGLVAHSKRTGDWDSFYSGLRANPAMLAKYFANNPGKELEWARHDQYGLAMGRWVRLLDKNQFERAEAYFDSLPSWMRQQYQSRHPGGSKGGGTPKDLAYINSMKRWVSFFEKDDMDGGMDFFRGLPAWMRERYYAKHPENRAKFESGGAYSQAMGRWVKLLDAGKDDEARAWFDGLPKWMQDRYGKKHPEAFDWEKDKAMAPEVAHYLTLFPADQAAYLRAHPKLASYIADRSDSETSRRYMILNAYRGLPADPWLKRVFKERYPEVFSVEAQALHRQQKFEAWMSENPEMRDEVNDAIAFLYGTYMQSSKYSAVRPQPLVLTHQAEAEEERRKLRRKRGLREWQITKPPMQTPGMENILAGIA